MQKIVLYGNGALTKDLLQFNAQYALYDIVAIIDDSKDKKTTNDITILETRFFNQIVNVFSGVFSILILGGSFLALNWKLGLSIIGFGIITTIIPLFFSQKINLKQLEYSDSISSLKSQTL